MPIHRVTGVPQTISPLPTGEMLYQVRLSTLPTPAWRAAFFHPPSRLTKGLYSPDHVDVHEGAIIFRSAPSQLEIWLRWIDGWIAYASSVVQG